ncbi:DNA binding protein [Gordonia phage Cafasso]|uniref:DNA binding protein n=1 Tax=Gordonia phage Cafasso TaxID=2851095 RepID=A0AAE7SEZ9_9CAUD|nr:DNA binding protein [Gordonia phage Cafasso]
MSVARKYEPGERVAQLRDERNAQRARELIRRPMAGLVMIAPPEAEPAPIQDAVVADPDTGELGITEVHTWGCTEPVRIYPPPPWIDQRLNNDDVRQLRKSLRDFRGINDCPYCGAVRAHWLALVDPADLDADDEYGADPFIIRTCRDCGLSWRENQ